MTILCPAPRQSAPEDPRRHTIFVSSYHSAASKQAVRTRGRGPLQKVFERSHLDGSIRICLQMGSNGRDAGSTNQALVVVSPESRLGEPRQEIICLGIGARGFRTHYDGDTGVPGIAVLGSCYLKRSYITGNGRRQQ
jgi:hypothetical protein